MDQIGFETLTERGRRITVGVYLFAMKKSTLA